MKKYFLIVSILLMACMKPAFAQSHWTFAKMFGGMPDNTPTNNVPYHMELDSDGNVYIFGTAGQMARIDTTYLGTVGGDNTRGSFLAKFNCTGELLWHKSVKCEQFDVNANWMQIKNDTIYILTELHYGLTENTFFIDTTIWASQTTYPYTFPNIPLSYYNVLLSFDKHGNKLNENYFQSANKRRLYNADIAPFLIDNHDNIFMHAQYRKNHDGGKYPYYLDSTPITDSIEFEENFNILLMKFSPNLELEWHKPLVDSVSDGKLFWMELYDLVQDSDNSLYYVGKALILTDSLSNEFYPSGKIYLADGHSIEFQEHGYDIGFAMKVDSSGTIQWLQQMYRFDGEEPEINSGYSSFHSISINNNALYVAGRGHARMMYTENTYSTFPNGDIFEAPCFDCSGTSNSDYIICFDKENGSVLWHTTPHTESSSMLGNIEFAQDSLYVGIRWGQALHFGDSVYTHDGTKYVTIGFSHLTYNTQGELCSVRNLRTDDGYEVYAHDTKVDALGNIWFTGRMDADLAFGEDTSLNTGVKRIFLARYGEDCPINLDTDAYLCFGETFTMGEQSFTEPGNYQFIIENESGADTLVNLNLYNYPELLTSLPADTTICIDEVLELQANPGFDSYYWSDESIGSSTQFTYDDAGTYTEYLIVGMEQSIGENTAYCEHTDSIQIQVDICDGLTEELTLNFTVYPNPAKDKLTVDVEFYENCTLELIDSYGRQCKYINLESTSTVIDLNNLAEGVYMLRLSNDKETKTERVIKQ